VLQRGGFGDIIRESPIDYHKLEEPCLRITARKQTTLSEILSEESLLNETIVHYQQQIKKFMAALSQVKSVKESSTKSSAEAVGNIAEATSNIEMAKQMPPHNCSAFNDEGKLYYAGGEWHKAESSFQKALAISARNVEAAYGLSMVYLKQKRKEESIIALKKCMAIEPSFENAASLLKQQLLDSTLLEGRELPAHRKYTFMHVAWEDKKTSFPEMTPAVILAFDTITKHIPGISLLACSRRKLCDYPWEVIDIIRENKRINFREMVEESVSLNSGTVFLYPANSDAYRLNLIRVLQSGIPVIAAVSFARGIVEHGYNGLLVQVEDVRRNGHCQYLVRVNDLAMKMAFLAKDPELISEMTAHALQRRNALK
jgi:tetratricopeptide (TPR) repeat protein